LIPIVRLQTPSAASQNAIPLLSTPGNAILLGKLLNWISERTGRPGARRDRSPQPAVDVTRCTGPCLGNLEGTPKNPESPDACQLHLPMPCHIAPIHPHRAIGLGAQTTRMALSPGNLSVENSLMREL
jgi:hypothetical protein